LNARGAVVCTACAMLLCASGMAAAQQTLYKWIDKDGKTQYGDHVPKGFTGPVTRIEIDIDTTPRAPDKTEPPAKALPVEESKPAAVDIAKQRRELRVKLAAQVAIARDRLDAAKAALEQGGDPQDSERQVIQQRFAQAQPGRSNCRAVTGADGKKGAMCPALIPSDAYYERQKQLEDAVKEAQAALSAAEEAYRRGVD
jgi:Domain of unknown function (DUF4124)